VTDDDDTQPSLRAVRPGDTPETLRLRRIIKIRHLLTNDPLARLDVQRFLDEQSPRRRSDPIWWVLVGIAVGAILGGAICGWLS